MSPSVTFTCFYSTSRDSDSTCWAPVLCWLILSPCCCWIFGIFEIFEWGDSNSDLFPQSILTAVHPQRASSAPSQALCGKTSPFPAYSICLRRKGSREPKPVKLQPQINLRGGHGSCLFFNQKFEAIIALPWLGRGRKQLLVLWNSAWIHPGFVFMALWKMTPREQGERGGYFYGFRYIQSDTDGKWQDCD